MVGDVVGEPWQGIKEPIKTNPRCEECGEKLRTLRVEKTVEGWIWCRKCGLVSNDWETKGMRVDEFVWWVKEKWPELKVADLRVIGQVAGEKGQKKAIGVLGRILEGNKVEEN